MRLYKANIQNNNTMFTWTQIIEIKAKSELERNIFPNKEEGLWDCNLHTIVPNMVSCSCLG